MGIVRWISVVLLGLASVAGAAEPMRLGTNWHKRGDCFNDVKDVRGENP